MSYALDMSIFKAANPFKLRLVPFQMVTKFKSSHHIVCDKSFKVGTDHRARSQPNILRG